MPDSPEPHGHGLGPHVLGHRIVVRRVLPGVVGPSGGPAMTDLLGVCTAWADGVCVVQPETGPPVRIAVHDIVSGKPVPPRPATRLRVGAAEAQRRALALWPDLETEPLGGWLLRSSPTEHARRANSVLALGERDDAQDAADDLDDDEVHDRVVAYYRDRARRPIAALAPGTAAERLFLSRGWVPESGDADTVFEVAGVARARRLLRPDPPGTDEVRLTVTGGLAVADLGERARGVAAVAGDWVGFRGIEVAPAHRRGGLGLAVMAALLEWGAERGATTAYLQVIGDNTPALGLYDRLGFVEHHRYRYLAHPDR